MTWVKVASTGWLYLEVMKITKDTKVLALIEAEPYMLEALIEINQGFDKLRNPVFRNTMARLASLETVAGFMAEPLDGLLKQVRGAVLKNIIESLHGATDLSKAQEEAKGRFGDLVQDIDAAEIGAMEQALMQGGMPAEEIKRLCSVHVGVFQESLDTKPVPQVAPDHALAVFFDENRAIEELMARMDDTLSMMVAPSCPSLQGGTQKPGESGDCGSCGVAPEDEEYLVDQERFRFLIKDLERICEWFGKVDLHYQRKENQLFPVLEAHEITGPSQVMWSLDDEIRAQLKDLRQAVLSKDAVGFASLVGPAMKALADMIYKEERILFPLCLEHFDQAAWARVKSGEAGLGPAMGLPGKKEPATAGGSPTAKGLAPAPGLPGASEGRLELSTGSLSLEEARAVFVHLPIDISFVNADDEVVFFSDNPERIFPRTASVIGRKVQFCHPPRSMHLVQTILDDFRAGTRKHAEFWIDLGGRFIYIQYFAVRNPEGSYLGCMEASQDLTRLRSLEGQKRLLDPA